MAKLLANYLIQIVESDARIETKREVLAEMNDFEPRKMFNNLLKYDE